MTTTSTEVLTHAVRWDQVLANPAIGTHSGDQTATVQGGNLIVPEGWRVEFHYENPQPTAGEWNGETRIVRVDVFDQNGSMAYAYKPMNPGQYARIQPDLSGVGDCYARIDLSVMVSNDPSAPRLGSIVITNGKNSFADLPQTFPRGNGAYDLVSNCPVPCFTAETLVYTFNGVAQVQDVCPGDLVWVFDFERGCYTFSRVLWHGKRTVKADEQNAPIRFRGEDYSPQHRILVNADGEYRWIKAKFLAELGAAEKTPEDGRPVEYHHLLLSKHSGIVTAQSVVESLLVTETSKALFAGHEFADDVSRENPLQDVRRNELPDLATHLRDRTYEIVPTPGNPPPVAVPEDQAETVEDLSQN